MPARRQEVPSQAAASLEEEVSSAMQHLAKLKEALGETSSALSGISEQALRESRSLRTTVREYKEFYFFQHQNDPKYL